MNPTLGIGKERRKNISSCTIFLLTRFCVRCLAPVLAVLTVPVPLYPKAAEFLRLFLEHCAHQKNYATGKTGSRLDFIAFHPKGSPKWEGGHVRMGIARQLASIEEGFKIVQSFRRMASHTGGAGRIGSGRLRSLFSEGTSPKLLSQWAVVRSLYRGSTRPDLCLG